MRDLNISVMDDGAGLAGRDLVPLSFSEQCRFCTSCGEKSCGPDVEKDGHLFSHVAKLAFLIFFYLFD